MLLTRCKFKCYSHHFIIYSDLKKKKNVLNFFLLRVQPNNFLNFCNLVWLHTYETHIPTSTPDPRRHSSADFNNAKDIFVHIQFVTID